MPMPELRGWVHNSVVQRLQKVRSSIPAVSIKNILRPFFAWSTNRNGSQFWKRHVLTLTLPSLPGSSWYGTKQVTIQLQKRWVKTHVQDLGWCVLLACWKGILYSRPPLLPTGTSISFPVQFRLPPPSLLRACSRERLLGIHWGCVGRLKWVILHPNVIPHTQALLASIVCRYEMHFVSVRLQALGFGIQGFVLLCVVTAGKEGLCACRT